MGRPRKRGIDNVKDCLKMFKDVRQARRKVQDRYEWRGFMKRNASGVARGRNP